ncbi:MAG: tRNA (adenosine(37)-N6)-threonylcarbamoyltransferase complex dimerization subunit type 1 TsaB [Veillonellaceae bacterium]|nr:tRNA (adenosine(37)-N6)-threonylcarbamoyltransferase complex dimerization subunit type 1 TsaB [Veillonellaceae bacterium]
MILSLDTATLVSSVALVSEEKLIAELTIQTKKTHSEMLMPHIEKILKLAGVKKTDLTLVAVSIGPGSFTGLRIGLATAKALAYALAIPLVGVSTLEALAFNCPVPGALLSPMLDAQKGNVYQAIYKWQKQGLTEVLPPRVIGFEESVSELTQQTMPVLILGEGAVMHGTKLAGLANPVAATGNVVMPRAASVGFLAKRKFAQGLRHDVMTLEPIYIRRSEAEELWEKRHGACI